MKFNIKSLLIAGLVSFFGVSCNTDDTWIKCEDCDSQKIIDVTQYGLKNDASSDCSDLVNRLIADLPAEGGVILFPEGQYRLDSPIKVTRNFVTITGEENTTLIVNNSEAGINLAYVAEVNGQKNRLSGVEIRDIHLVGNDYNGTGVWVAHDNDRTQLINVTVEKCNLGMRINGADAIVINNCTMTDVTNGLEMYGGIQNSVTDCKFGSLSKGVTCYISGESNLLFSDNELNGAGENGLMVSGTRINVSDCTVEGPCVGLFELNGDNNLVSDNVFTLKNTGADQLAGRSADYGVVLVKGSYNHFTSNTIECEWDPEIENPITVSAASGDANRFSNCTVTDQLSEYVFYVNESTEVIGCVDAAKISIKTEVKNLTKIAYIIDYADPSQIEDDDEQASYAWFKREFVNGKVLTTSEVPTADLSQFDVIWIHIDRMNMPVGWQNLPSGFLSDDVLNALKVYYYGGGGLLLANHATQYIVPLGRTERAPGLYSSGNGGSGNDSWSVQANIGMEYDRRTHPVYEGVIEFNEYHPHPTFPLIGPGHREDHNCMWDFNAYGFMDLYPDAENVLRAFEVENNAVVLGTWGQVTDFAVGGLIEFQPTEECKGTCLAMGLAAYEWNQNTNANKWHDNIITITRNMVSYLAGNNQ